MEDDESSLLETGRVCHKHLVIFWAKILHEFKVWGQRTGRPLVKEVRASRRY